MSVLETALQRVGTVREAFDCCDTEFLLQASGFGAARGVASGRATAERLEARLDAFDERSDVARLNREGSVGSQPVARVVRRGLEYHERTDGVFDITQGRVEHDLKAYLRGASDTLPERFDTGAVSLNGDLVETAGPLDLNGLAKGYIVDRAAAAASGPGRHGFASGGGDMSPPPGPIAVESPYGDERPLTYLRTDWAVASSAGYRRNRAGTDHIYDPTTERLGSRHDLVTVVARRDCMEADALATTLAALPPGEALALAERWDGLEALVVHGGVLHRTRGFDEHVLDD